MPESLTPFAWVGLSLPILLITQRWTHRHLRGLALLLTGNPNWSVVLYAIILFPGVLLHELSHWLTAGLLGVRTGAFSVLPKLEADGSVTLGYVQYYKGRHVGPFQESLIGAAPLITGTAVLLLIAFRVFGVSDLAAVIQRGDVDSLLLALQSLFATNDFLLWLYLLFAIGNAMMPSASDRRGWPVFLGLLVGLAVILYLVGLREVLIQGLAGPVATVFGYLGLAFSLAIAVNLLFMTIIALLERLIGRLKGVDVTYGE